MNKEFVSQYCSGCTLFRAYWTGEPCHVECVCLYALKDPLTLEGCPINYDKKYDKKEDSKNENN